MKRTTLALGLLVLLGAPLAGCRSVTEPPSSPAQVDVTEDDRITITDHTGKVWDITHAVNEFGFDPEKFQYGVGIGTIPPVFDPQFVAPGEAGFPSASVNFLVLGTQISNDARAYVIPALSTHEVVNDRFGEAYVAVAY